MSDDSLIFDGTNSSDSTWYADFTDGAVSHPELEYIKKNEDLYEKTLVIFISSFYLSSR